MADLEIHSEGDFQQDLTPKSAWLLLYLLMCTPLFDCALFFQRAVQHSI